jgi:hypothetical protein
MRPENNKKKIIRTTDDARYRRSAPQTIHTDLLVCSAVTPAKPPQGSVEGHMDCTLHIVR